MRGEPMRETRLSTSAKEDVRNTIPYRAGDARSSRRRRTGPADEFSIYFANITSWHEAAKAYLSQPQDAMGGSHVVCTVETHLKGNKLLRAVKEVDKLGWRATMEAAVQTPEATRAGPGHGGVAVLVRKHLHAAAITPDMNVAVQQDEHKGLQTQWTGFRVRLAVMDVLVAVVYLAPDLGLQGANWVTLMELAGYIKQQGIPFIVVGDYNMEEGEMAPAGLPQYLTAVWRHPKGPVPGGHRPIDFALVSRSLDPVVDIAWDPNSPWAQPHTGFVVKVARRALGLQVQELQNPISYSAAMGPDLPWDHYAAREGRAIEEGQRQAAALRGSMYGTSAEVDKQYTAFCVTAESLLANRQGVGLEQQATRRGWPVGVRTRALLPPRPVGWVARNVGLPTWRALHSRVTNYIGVTTRKRWAQVGVLGKRCASSYNESER